MTNHDRFIAVFKNRVGRTFSSAEIRKIMLAESDIEPGSILPNDHAEGNAGGCWCARNRSNQPIFERIGSRLYLVREVGSTALPGQSRPVEPFSPTPRIGSGSKLVIDDDFIREWHPRYDETEDDEEEYQRLVGVVAAEIGPLGTISWKTFEDVWRWKKAYRRIDLIRRDLFDTVYADAFRHAIAEPAERKLAALIGFGVKLPGVGAPTGSTLIHLMHPESMPIIDVRTVECLFEAGMLSSKDRDLVNYDAFRRAIDEIRQRCPGWTLRQIDRALFAYHKQVLDKQNRCA